jgi:hypothetical protein
MRINNASQAKKIPFLIVTLLALIACNLFGAAEPPGVGEKAERGYAALDPIIKALEQYRNDKGTYPELLDELVPDYIPDIPKEVNDESIFYAKTGGSFALSFHYLGPGMNTCTYTPEKQWQCSGAY